MSRSLNQDAERTKMPIHISESTDSDLRLDPPLSVQNTNISPPPTSALLTAFAYAESSQVHCQRPSVWLLSEHWVLWWSQEPVQTS